MVPFLLKNKVTFFLTVFLLVCVSSGVYFFTTMIPSAAVSTLVCIDADQDGYGVVANANCRYPVPDCNDNDPLRNPGIVDSCIVVTNSNTGSGTILNTNTNAPVNANLNGNLNLNLNTNQSSNLNSNVNGGTNGNKNTACTREKSEGDKRGDDKKKQDSVDRVKKASITSERDDDHEYDDDCDEHEKRVESDRKGNDKSDSDKKKGEKNGDDNKSKKN